MRLTVKTDDSSYKIEDFFRARRAIDKLGQLEDSEEEFGIDFITLFNTLKRRGVYIKRAFWPELGDYTEIHDTEVVHLDFVPDEEGIDDAIRNSWVLVFVRYYYGCPEYMYVRVRDMDDTWSAI